MSDFDRLCEMIADIFECEKEEITRDTDFINDLCADSLDGLELAIMIEEEFGTRNATKSDFAAYHTVGDVAEILENKSR